MIILTQYIASQMRYFCIFLLLVSFQLSAQIPVALKGYDFKTFDIKNNTYIIEDADNAFSIKSIMEKDVKFVPLQHYNLKDNKSAYWLKIALLNSSTVPAAGIISIPNISSFSTWLFVNNELTEQRTTGSFALQQNISDVFDKHYKSILLPPVSKSVLIIKVPANNGLKKVTCIEITGENVFFNDWYKKKSIDLLIFGAIFILIIYIFFSYILSRYHVYLWLLLFSFGIGMYLLCIHGYFSNIFLQGYEKYNFFASTNFVLIGLLGAYFLLDYFLIYHKRIHKFHRIFKLAPLAYKAGFVINIIAVFGFHDFYFPLWLGIGAIMVIVLFCASYPFALWKKFGNEERIFAISVIIGSLLGIFHCIFIGIKGSDTVILLSAANRLGLLVVILFLLLGIKEGNRRGQKNKNKLLSKLNKLQEEQNTILEEKVKERTQELDARSKNVENLMHELQHRVKNNLQLLYSLNKMEKPAAADATALSIWQTNLSRIIALKLANSRFLQVETAGNVYLHEYLMDLVEHTRQLFETEQNNQLIQQLQPGIVVKVSDLVTIGLIVVELLSNSYKHAFKSNSGQIIQTLTLQNGKYYFTHEDTGEGFESQLFKEKEVGGFLIIKDLTRQLGGYVKTYPNNTLLNISEAEVKIKEDNFTTRHFCFIFPANRKL